MNMILCKNKLSLCNIKLLGSRRSLSHLKSLDLAEVIQAMLEVRVITCYYGLFMWVSLSSPILPIQKFSVQVQQLKHTHQGFVVVSLSFSHIHSRNIVLTFFQIHQSSTEIKNVLFLLLPRLQTSKCSLAFPLFGDILYI